jgi:hypothetical protein
MFAAHCPEHGSEVLLPFSRLRCLRNTPLGIELAFECWCGASLEILTGYSAAEPVCA